MKNKKKEIIFIVVIVAAALAALLVWWRLVKVPHDQAVKEYEETVQIVQKNNKTLDDAISEVKKILKSGDKPLDEKLLDSAKNAVKKAEDAEEKVPEEMPDKTDEIRKATSRMKTDVSYDSEIKELTDLASKCTTSIQQRKQVTNPDESFVIERLGKVSAIVGSQAVTEDNDPNGNLNKSGGYTADVYFQASNVDQSEVYTSGDGSIIDKGTEGGGCVEVYANEEDAKKRNDYLAGFDGGILANGSHTVVGTCVVRTSDLLTASQQKELEQAVINALTAVE